MKIGIITLPLHENYGGILQAFALQKFLKNIGYSALIVSIEEERVKLGKKVERLSRKIFRYFFPKPKKSIERRGMARFVRENISMTRKIPAPVSYKKLSPYRFDALIVGSDQVWRRKYISCLPDQQATFFLGFCGNNKTVRRVAFSASFGSDSWEFTTKETQKLSTLAKKFHAISVREDSGVELCRKHLGVHAEHLVDPTMLLDKSEYEKIVESDEDRGLLNPPDNNSRRILSYILDDSMGKTLVENIVSGSLGMAIEKIIPTAEELGSGIPFPPVSAWLRGFRDAEFVVTDSFHGSVFSIIFNKPFLAIGNAKRGMARFDSLLKMFGLENRLLLVPENFSEGDFSRQIREIVHASIDWKKINANLQREQFRAMKFLAGVLN